MNWSDIRPHDGSQAGGFEELCSQLARLEVPDGAEFFRTGNPDGGVECYCRLEDGGEWGWQAKFFRDPLGEPQWKQLDRSVETALDSHPHLVRYVVCVPRDRADGRRPNATTEMQKWESRADKWEEWARERGMQVEFEWSGSSELTHLLSQDQQAGRLRYWFGSVGQFSDEWFARQHGRAVGVAGPRYTPEVHVEVPLVDVFEVFGRLEPAIAKVRGLAKDIREKPVSVLRRHLDAEAVDTIAELNGVDQALGKVVEALGEVRCLPSGEWRLSGIMSDIDDAVERLGACAAPLQVAAGEHDAEHKNKDGPSGYWANPYHSADRELREVRIALLRTKNALSRIDRIVNSDLMIVKGEAGSGKTHLLCDMAGVRLRENLPTVVLMGQQFTTTESPWTQILAHLDLRDMSAEQFVGALEAAAQAADCRALFMIDAINEGEGYRIWPEHLGDLLTQLRASEWIAVVLSVRTPYMEHVVSNEVLESAHVVTHHGFQDDTYRAVARFCDHYGLDFPTTPLLRPEFDNPLFLKTLCKGLHHAGKRRIPVGSEGIGEVFGRFLDAIDSKLAPKLDYDPQGRLVRKALDAVASSLAEANTRFLSRYQIQDLVNSYAPVPAFSRSLYRALVDEGLLMESPNISGSGTIAYFGYEWFADYMIAEHIINDCADASDVAVLLASDNRSGPEDTRRVWNVPLEALSVLLPERLGIELPEVIPQARRRDPRIVEAFLAGLPYRNQATIGTKCQKLVELLLSSGKEEHIEKVLDVVVVCSLVPDHPLGSAFLDAQLRHLQMPARDGVWTAYLHSAYGNGGPVDRLLEWANGDRDRLGALDSDAAAACTKVLAWFLTASNRFVRDQATKGLVALLDTRIELTVQLVKDFDDVDDPYVRERVMAAAYGVAMRSNEAEVVAPLADLVYQLIFADGEPPPHILLRDYARGIIERALFLGADITVDETLVEPPYRSTWPDIPFASELEKLYSRTKDGDFDGPDTDQAQSRIWFSVMMGDFARYVIGTNSSSESYEWLAVANDAPTWESPTEIEGSFRRSLTPDMQRSLDRLCSRTYTDLFAAFEPDIETDFVEQLSEEQRAAYETAKAVRDTDEPRLSLDIIQRYILWRIIDLGWTVDRFGKLDSRISSAAIHAAQGRHNHQFERVGKKYQWIAYHEILAFISDRYQYRTSEGDPEPDNTYKGTWQLWVRDIDPSMIFAGARFRHEKSAKPEEWWRHHAPVASIDEMSHEQWLQEEYDIPDREQQLRYTNPEDSSTWIKLEGFDIWSRSTTEDFVPTRTIYRDIWLKAHGYLVYATDIDEFVAWSEAADFWNNWMPEPPGELSLFFGELGWSFAFNSAVGDHLKDRYPKPRAGTRCPVPLQLPCVQYLDESDGRDGTLLESLSLYRPSPHLVEAMGLHWSGEGANFEDASGALVAFDPSAYGASSSALLVREETLRRYLSETGSALVWAILGGKSALDPAYEHEVAGSLEMTGAAVLTADGPAGRLSSQLILPD